MTDTEPGAMEGSGWHHLSGGFMFQKRPGGRVRIGLLETFESPPIAETECGPSEWASVVAFVSTLGDTSHQHARAYMLHRRGFEEVADLTARLKAAEEQLAKLTTSFQQQNVGLLEIADREHALADALRVLRKRDDIRGDLRAVNLIDAALAGQPTTSRVEALEKRLDETSSWFHHQNHAAKLKDWRECKVLPCVHNAAALGSQPTTQEANDDHR